MSDYSPDSKNPVLRAVGLHRRELRAWAMYDWANSAFATTIMAAVMPIYYAKVAAAPLEGPLRVAYWGYTQTVALVIIALTAPVLGAMADYLGAKKRFLASFVVLGALGTAALYFVESGDYLFASACFIIGNIGFASGNIFYEALLPHVARPDELDRVSTAGYAIGYLGGGLLLALNLAWIQMPETFGFADSGQASRASFLSVAVWWVVFSLPLLRRVSEPTPPDQTDRTTLVNPITASITRLRQTFAEVRKHRDAFTFLIAFWLYNDGIVTIIKMATIYGQELGLGQGHLIGALVLTQFLGIPFTFLFGLLAGRISAKRGIYLSICIYTAISILGYFMAEAWHFWALAVGVAMVQGGSQALSRSIFGSMVPRERAAEFFGFYSISGKFGNILGPFVFAVVSHAMGDSRLGILSLIFFFVAGGLMLTRVDIARGQRAL